jgi:hypothetical protein
MKRRSFLAGLLLTFCFLTKAYFLPVLLAIGYLAYISFSKNQLRNWMIGLSVGMIPLLPFLIGSSADMFHQLFGFSLNRPATYAQYSMLGYLLTTDYALLIFFCISLLLPIPYRRFWIVLISVSTLAFIFARDFHYLYFSVFMPFVAIGAGRFVAYINEKL